MDRVKRIEAVLKKLNPDILEITDESYLHKGHRESSGGEFTHIRIKISDIYGDIPLVLKHREIKELLKDEFESGMHSLSISFK